MLRTVVRPLVKRSLASEALPALSGPMALAGAGASAGAAALPLEEPREHAATRLMEFAKINGQIQAQTVERVVEMVRGNPTETVEVLRNWIHDT